MKLVFKDEPFSSTQKLPPLWRRIKEFLDGSKTGHLFSTGQVASEMNCSVDSLISRAHYFLPIYQQQYDRRKYWGKPRTISELKKREDDRRKKRG